MKRNRRIIRIHPTAKVCRGAMIGKQFRPLLDGTRYDVAKETVIEKGVHIGPRTIVGAGSFIGAGSILDDFSIVECEVVIGKRNLLIYRAQVCNAVRIGNDCVIGGFIGENTMVGNNCRIFGKVVHAQFNPLLDWDGRTSEEGAPRFEDFSFVGFGAVIAGKVTIGRKAYIMAGAIVTRNVPALHIASGVNGIVHFSKWQGKLRESPFFCKD